MTEHDIMHEAGAFWVARERKAYTVYRVNGTHSVSDSSYAKDPDGLSLARARCDYLHGRATGQRKVYLNNGFGPAKWVAA